MKLNKNTFHPILFGIFPIISLFEGNMHFTSISEIILPIIITLVIIIPSWMFLKIILKDKVKSALIVSFLVILFFTYSPIFLVIDDFTINGEDVGRHSFLLISFLLFGISGIIFLIKTKQDLKIISDIINIVSLIIVSIILVSIVTYSFENSYSVEIENFENIKSIQQMDEVPDIYYIIFDGYAGKTSLKNISGHDNQEFLNILQDQGFFIQEKSYANYAHTFLSIPSVLNMQYLNYLAEDLDGSKSRAIPYELGSNNKVMNFVKSQGYVTVNFDSGWGFTRDMKSSDLKICGDNKLFNSEFLITLMNNSMLNPIYVKFFETDKIEGMLCIFDELPKIKERTTKPIFVFAHVFSPHPPYIFDEDGQIRQLETLDPRIESEDSLDKEKYIGQLKFLNKKIIEVVKQLLDSEKQPIIIIQSDHGTAFTFGNDKKNWDIPTDEMVNERMDSINWIFLPGNTTNIFSESTTNVNTFRILFNHYFKTEFEILEDKVYLATDGSYELEDVTNRLKNP